MRHVPLVLLTMTLVAAGSTTAWAQAAEPVVTVVDPATAKFAPVPNIPPCMTASVLRGDPAKGESVILAKGTAGCVIPRHWHTPNEQLGMVSGVARLSMRSGKPAVLRPGGYAYVPSKHQHVFACRTACTFFVVSDAALDIHYVDRAGQEISLEQAMKASAPAAGAKPGPAKTK